MNTLRVRLTISHACIVLLTVAIISILSNVMLERVFKQYVMKQQTASINELIIGVGEQYSANNNSWHLAVIENLGMNALSDGLIVKVADTTNKYIWDATMHNNGQCQMMIENMAKNMYSLNPSFKGNYVENKYELKKGDKLLGYLYVGYYGPYFFTDNDLYFVKTLNGIFAWVAVGSIFFSIIGGIFMSRHLSIPISNVIKIAGDISEGNFGTKVTAKSNITEIKSLVQTINNLSSSLERLERLRKQLTSDVAHELRTPLSALQCHIEAMIDGIWDPTTERLESCHDEIMRITRMVEDLQQLTNIENANIKLELSEFDLSKLMDQIYQNFESDFKSKDISIKLNNNSKGNIVADRDKLSQIIINLVSNALKYSSSGGKVELTTIGNEKDIQIIVEDCGIGIPKEDLPYIFERFYRVDKSRSREVGGAGIGLAIVRALVVAHDGEITVESEVSKGTKFTVVIPSRIGHNRENG